MQSTTKELNNLGFRRAVANITSLFAVVLISQAASAQINVTVKPNEVLKAYDEAPLGLVLNQMNDGVLPLTSLKTAVARIKAKRLRFPEGESSDNYYFTDPSTLSNPNPATHRVANTAYWPASSDIADAEGRFYHGLNFDQFMSVARSAKAIPNVVLCYPCSDKPKALRMAKAWVKYSRDKGYDVLNWEFGNESYLNNTGYTESYKMTPQEYAKDLIEWSRALKAIDSRIKIGANGDPGWLKSVLAYKHPSLGIYAAQAIDFVAIHTYPNYNSSFAKYQSNKNGYGHTLDFQNEIKRTINVLNSIASVTPTKHIEIQMTETSAMTYGDEDPNNLGSAIMTVDLLSNLIAHPRLSFITVWASRWVTNFNGSRVKASDAFNSRNGLNPSGLAQSIVARFLGESAVSTTGTNSTLRVYANLSTVTGKTNVILVNRSNSQRAINLRVTGVSTISGRLHRLSGSPESTNPRLVTVGQVASQSNVLSLKVPATSVTIIEVNTPYRNRVKNPGFESSFLSWVKDWGSTAIVTSDVGSGQRSIRVGKMSGGRGQTVSGLGTEKSYTFKAKAKLSDDNGEIGYVGISFLDANGIDIPGYAFSAPVRSSSYSEVSFTAKSPASYSSAHVWVYKGQGNTYMFVDDFSLVPQ